MITPKVFLCSPADLYLDIGATEKAHGGEARVLAMADRLAENFLGSKRRFVVTDQPEWARALLSSRDLLVPRDQTPAFLKSLPIEQIASIGNPYQLEEERVERTRLVGFLRKVGITTIGAFTALPPDTIHHRFGKMGEVLYECTLGRRPLCLPLFTPEETIQDHLDAEELHSLEALLFAMRQVLVRVEARLHGRCQAAKSIRFTFNFESHCPVDKTIDFTEATQDAQNMLRVLREFLAGFQWQSPLVRLQLEITDIIAHSPGQLSLFSEAENKFYDLASFVARLRVRLGDDRVGFAALQSSHLPERSCALTWPPPPAPTKRESFPRRPLFLFTPPKPFHLSPRWSLSFLETLFVEWWEPGGCREYYLARNGQEALWVYRDNQKGEWFAHGTFD